ncbi:MAG: CDP-diacylglycerol--glycerol-3-phosphate 3-phosphatidyltransferase, partial [Planctomycetota bacterium]
PNKVTTARFILSIIYFVLLYLAGLDEKPEKFDKPIFYAGMVVFIIAALTDTLDGYLARRYNIVTKFGRIADPFVDKVLICGSFIFFVSWPDLKPFVSSWMVLVIVFREFLVHGLRTIAESKGVSFGSSIWGKQKTFTQCITVIWTLFYLVYMRYTAGEWWSAVLLKSLVWLTLFSTVFSALTYFYKIRKMLREVVDE